MDVTLKERYVPKFNGNRDLPKEDQFSVVVREMTTLELLAVRGQSLGQLQEWLTEHCPVSVSIEEDDQGMWGLVRIVDACAGDWKNLSINGKPVEGTWDLLGLGLGRFFDLIDEVGGQAMAFSSISEDEEKNSDGQPAGTGSEEAASAAD